MYMASSRPILAIPCSRSKTRLRGACCSRPTSQASRGSPRPLSSAKPGPTSSASCSGARRRSTASTDPQPREEGTEMARISPAAPEQFAQVAEPMALWQKTKGYPPNSWLTMARKPRVFRAYRELHTAVMMDDGEIPQALKFLVACVVSTAAGDPYCAAHNAENAAHIAGVPLAKVEALAQFRASPLYSPAERAALELASAAGARPANVTDAHFIEIRKHYGEDA